MVDSFLNFMKKYPEVLKMESSFLMIIIAGGKNDLSPIGTIEIYKFKIIQTFSQKIRELKKVKILEANLTQMQAAEVFCLFAYYLISYYVGISN